MIRPGNLSVVARGERDVVISRDFRAPRHLVFAAFTRPELIARWMLGPGGWVMEVCDVDLRVGGAYRYVWKRADGKTMGMGGEFRDIAAPERLVTTERFDDPWYPGEGLSTVELREAGGYTHMVNTITYESAEARDAVMRSPMESGLAAGYDRLEELAASL